MVKNIDEVPFYIETTTQKVQKYSEGGDFFYSSSKNRIDEGLFTALKIDEGGPENQLINFLWPKVDL